MKSSNSENNVTAQTFVPLVQSAEGKRLLGKWLTGTPGAAVREATFFWFPLRDEIANHYYNAVKTIDAWDGYQALFSALNLPLELTRHLPSGHPKSPLWRGARQKYFCAEVVAELASTEFDAAFEVDATGKPKLFLVEAKWLSPFGAGLRGLNQVQRSVCLALWLKQRFPDTEITYVVCSRSEAEVNGNLQNFLARSSWGGMQTEFYEPMAKLASHLVNCIAHTSTVRLSSCSWKSLEDAINKSGLITQVGLFIHNHGQGRKYRNYSAALIG